MIEGHRHRKGRRWNSRWGLKGNWVNPFKQMSEGGGRGNGGCGGIMGGIVGGSHHAGLRVTTLHGFTSDIARVRKQGGRRRVLAQGARRESKNELDVLSSFTRISQPQVCYRSIPGWVG